MEISLLINNKRAEIPNFQFSLYVDNSSTPEFQKKEQLFYPCLSPQTGASLLSTFTSKRSLSSSNLVL